jgi:hypothetical protein
MPTFRGPCDPTRGHSGGQNWTKSHSLTPVPGAPTPPSGQLGQTNARARDAVTQRDSGGHGATRFTGVGSPLTPGGGRK